MTWGGERSGAGRKRLVPVKRVRTMRLLDDEWEYLRKVLEDYRESRGIEASAAGNANIGQSVRQTKRDADGAALMEHMENLMGQLVHWYIEYKKNFSVENEKKYTQEEIRMRIDLLRLQIMTLAPHLSRHRYAAEVERDACTREECLVMRSQRFLGVFHDLCVTAWKEPKRLDCHEANMRLLGTYRIMKRKQEDACRSDKSIRDEENMSLPASTTA